jgi:NAD(P)-dependent dehydrogenase (short-subunit alcohol dehydrogenase family)
MLGATAMPNNGPYGAAKHAVNGLTRTAALELSPDPLSNLMV